MLASARSGAAAGIAVSLAAAMALGFAPAASGSPQPARTTVTFAPQLITVDTPTRNHKDLLNSLGLDLTEHAGHRYVEVVAHSQDELDLLAELGFTWDVRIADMHAREAEIAEINRAYAAAVETSELPSGRTSYRSLAQYESELDELAETYPDLVKPIVVGQSVEGRDLKGIEIAENVHDELDGRPTFLMFGLHHAREWPSGEMVMEFAYDLLTNHGTDARITDLMGKVRVLLVPVSNPDGFYQSYTQGQYADTREIDRGGTVSIAGNPGNAYKRKNCRVWEDVEGDGASCYSPSNLGYGIGVDLNRNYGALWGGPGTSGTTAADWNDGGVHGQAGYASAVYRGWAPFSEPETQAIRNLISTRQVTMLISNHTFSNLILRPNGVHPLTEAPDGFPVGFAPDEHAMKELGAEMAANNGYANIHGWELYDTTGTTEDYSYNATGGFGYTFEVGPHEFHPPFPEVVDEYVGAGEYAGKGNRAAYLRAMEAAIDPETHAIVDGTAPAGAELTVSRTAETPTWNNANNFEDTVTTSTVVGEDGTFEWHLNPSTRPFVMGREALVIGDEPITYEEWSGNAPMPPAMSHHDVEYTLAEDAAVLQIDLAATHDDYDMEVYYRDGEDLKEVGSSGNFPGEAEQVLLQDAPAGDYVIRIVNYAAVEPWHLSASTFESEIIRKEGTTEAWTLTCAIDGEVVSTSELVIGRGERQTIQPCGSSAVLSNGQAPAPAADPLPATGGGMVLAGLAALGAALAGRRMRTTS